MKNIKFSRLFAAAMLVACFAFAGCKPQVQEKLIEVSIYGTWVDDFENYNTYDDYDCKIAINCIETACYGKHIGPVYITKTSENSGYVYYQFKNSITGYDSNGNAFTVDATGKWGAIAFKNLTKDSVKMCDVADPTYDFPATLEECISKYTVESEDGYFKYFPTFFKQ